jgi:hypothetical protein
MAIGRRIRWLVFALLYFAVSMALLPYLDRSKNSDQKLAAAEQANSAPRGAYLGEMAAFGLGIFGMLIVVHGVFSTHPGRYKSRSFLTTQKFLPSRTGTSAATPY